MKKYVVETYYTCTFKTIHTLNNLDDDELSKIDQRNDGEVEVIDVKLNNRKTKKVGNKKEKPIKKKIENVLNNNLSNQVESQNNKVTDNYSNKKLKITQDLKCLIGEKVIYKKHK